MHGVGLRCYYPMHLLHSTLILSRFLKLGLQGVSVLFASGDNGVAGPPGDGNSVNGCLNNGTVFSPAFPNR